MKHRNIGIMGGTFNPIHTGHLILAESAYEQYQLDEIIFMPLKKPPHKDFDEVISDKHRTNMIQLAIADNFHFSFSSLELERKGITYTVDTINQLIKENLNINYYFIIGGDSLFDLESWKQPEKLLRIVTILATSRYGIEEEKMKQHICYLNQKYKGNIRLLQVPTFDISSKQLRRWCQEEKSIQYYVPTVVWKYIQQYQLYKRT